MILWCTVSLWSLHDCVMDMDDMYDIMVDENQWWKRKGIPTTPEAKLKMRLAKLWKKSSEETRRKISIWNKWRKVSDETKLKIGKTRKWIKMTPEQKSKLNMSWLIHNSWSKSHLWKWWKMEQYPDNERVRKSMLTVLWRKTIFIRDNFTCQKCKVSWWILNAHHINNFADFPELRFDIDNWITLCEKCHREFHKLHTRYNNTKEQLKSFIN